MKVLERQKEQQQQQEREQQCNKRERLFKWLRSTNEHSTLQRHQHCQQPVAAALPEGFFDTENEVEETLYDLFDTQGGRQLLIRKELEKVRAGGSTIDEHLFRHQHHYESQHKHQQQEQLLQQNLQQQEPIVGSPSRLLDATPSCGTIAAAAVVSSAEFEIQQDGGALPQQQQIRQPPVGLAGAETAFWQGTPWDVGLEDWEVPAGGFGVAEQQQQQKGQENSKFEHMGMGYMQKSTGTTGEEEEVQQLLQLLLSMALPVLRDDAAGSSMRCVQHISRVSPGGNSSSSSEGGGPNISATTLWLYRRSLLDFDFYENEDVRQQQKQQEEPLLPESLSRRLSVDRKHQLEETLRAPLPQASLLSLLRLLEVLDGLPMQLPLKGRIAALLLHAVDWAVRAREAISFLPRVSGACGTLTGAAITSGVDTAATSSTPTDALYMEYRSCSSML